MPRGFRHRYDRLPFGSLGAGAPVSLRVGQPVGRGLTLPCSGGPKRFWERRERVSSRHWSLLDRFP
eukprot:5961572-Heterocapsa_arctica.AAC.1